MYRNLNQFRNLTVIIFVYRSWLLRRQLCRTYLLKGIHHFRFYHFKLYTWFWSGKMVIFATQLWRKIFCDSFAYCDSRKICSHTVNLWNSIFSSSFRETPYEDWSCVDVCDWLASIGMAEHSELFRENDIRGTNLLGLTKEDLRELGVKKLGHRMTITNEVNRLTTNNGAATNL